MNYNQDRNPTQTGIFLHQTDNVLFDQPAANGSRGKNKATLHISYSSVNVINHLL
jgi:hypothetical protein